MDGQVTPHQQAIDDVVYTATTYPATEGLRLMTKLGQLLDPEHVRLLVHGDDGGLSWEQLVVLLQNPAVLVALLGGVLGKAAQHGSWTLPQELLSCTRADKVKIGDGFGVDKCVGETAYFNSHFAGRYPHLLKVVMYAARVGFGVPLNAAP